MVSELRAFIELLHLGLNPEKPLEFKVLNQPGLSWQTVFTIASVHKLYGVVFDGLKEMNRRFEAGELSAEQFPSVRQFQSKECKRLKMDWLCKIFADEEYYNKQVAAVQKISTLWHENGLHPILLKGLAIAQFYPIPSHRFSTDIDTLNYVNWDLSNQLVTDTGIAVDADYYKNSTFKIDDVLVENHRFCTPLRGDSRKKEYERYLRSLLDKEPLTELEGTHALCPPPMFSALFFMSHAHHHFLIEGGLRVQHFCDWAMLMRAYASVLDWQEFDRQCHRFGFDHFAWAMSYAAKYATGVSLAYECQKFPDEIQSLILSVLKPQKNIVDYSKNALSVRVQVIKCMLESRWKFRMFSDRSITNTLFHLVFSCLFERKPSL